MYFRHQKNEWLVKILFHSLGYVFTLLIYSFAMKQLFFFERKQFLFRNRQVPACITEYKTWFTLYKKEPILKFKRAQHSQSTPYGHAVTAHCLRLDLNQKPKPKPQHYMGLMEMRAVLAAEHPMSRICHCSTLSLLVKGVTFTSVLASVHQKSRKALLPHSV